jgi:hypothetical protein
LEEIRPETALSPGPSRDDDAGVPSTNGEGTPEMGLLIWWPESLGNRVPSTNGEGTPEIGLLIWWPESLGNRKGDYFCFDSVFIKKNNQTKILF